MKIIAKISALITGITVAATSSFAMEVTASSINSLGRSGFIAKQGGVVIKTVGKFEERRAPFSTFKVPLALMGFDAGILENKDSPRWEFKEEYEKNLGDWYTPEQGKAYGWRQAHTPATFIKYSAVWYSHQITQRLGAEKFKAYVSSFHYGNSDVSGTPDKDDGLFQSWLGTSLEISPREQVEFLEKLLANRLPVSQEAHEKTREVMDRGEIWDGWKLYGKTGGGHANDGWFVGWIEKDGQHIIFAQYLDLDDPNLDLTGVTRQPSVGLTAKELIKRELQNFWKQS